MMLDRLLPSFDDIKRVFSTLLRSSFIGTFIGCVPGTGGDIASFVSYDQAKRWSKHSKNFGNGEPEGIVASEAGNNAVSGGAFICADAGYPRRRRNGNHDGCADGSGSAARSLAFCGEGT